MVRRSSRTSRTLISIILFVISYIYITVRKLLELRRTIAHHSKVRRSCTMGRRSSRTSRTLMSIILFVIWYIYIVVLELRKLRDTIAHLSKVRRSCAMVRRSSRTSRTFSAIRRPTPEYSASYYHNRVS